MNRKQIIKNWELEFGVKYKDYQRANVYTSVDIVDFAETIVKLLNLHDVSNNEAFSEVSPCHTCAARSTFMYNEPCKSCQKSGNGWIAR
jgi:hypothetical protein